MWDSPGSRFALDGRKDATLAPSDAIGSSIRSNRGA